MAGTSEQQSVTESLAAANAREVPASTPDGQKQHTDSSRGQSAGQQEPKVSDSELDALLDSKILSSFTSTCGYRLCSAYGVLYPFIW